MTLALFIGLLISSFIPQELIMNKGIAGNTSSDLLERIESDVIAEDPDLVLVMVGTNDMLNSSKMLSYEEYASNLTEIVRRLKKRNIEVLLLSPPTVDTSYLFERHDKSLFVESPNQKLDSVSRMMQNISAGENVGFLDIHRSFSDLGLPQHNSDNYIQNEINSDRRDGVHPTGHGYSFISKQIFQYLEVEMMLQKDMKIICFGDSITRGSNVEGSGTSTGKTYPAYLSAMITNKFSCNNDNK